MDKKSRFSEGQRALSGKVLVGVFPLHCREASFWVVRPVFVMRAANFSLQKPVTLEGSLPG